MEQKSVCVCVWGGGGCERHTLGLRFSSSSAAERVLLSAALLLEAAGAGAFSAFLASFSLLLRRFFSSLERGEVHWNENKVRRGRHDGKADSSPEDREGGLGQKSRIDKKEYNIRLGDHFTSDGVKVELGILGRSSSGISGGGHGGDRSSAECKRE